MSEDLFWRVVRVVILVLGAGAGSALVAGLWTAVDYGRRCVL